MPASRKDAIPHARAKFAQGYTLEQIAAALGVAPSTIARWKRADAKAGVRWDDLRQERREKDPLAALAVLEQRFLDLVAEKETAPGANADAIYKLDRVIEHMRNRLGDVSTVLGVLQGFAEWAGKRVSEDDLAVLRRAIELYLADLKRRNT